MRTEKGQNTVSLSTVWRKISKMPHRNVTTEVARFNLAKQLLIRGGKLDPTKTLDPPMPRTDDEGSKDVVDNPNKTFVVDEETPRDPA
eukprot:7519774-Ditylum_brightwellii.AAC.1